jgi:hypothetical protein
MAEALVTLVGLILAAIATIVSLTARDKSKTAQRTLVVIALLSLVGGGVTTCLQYQGQQRDDKRANCAEKQLSELRTRMASLGITDEGISRKMNDLTALDQLGDSRYCVVIDTFRKNSPKDNTSFNNVLKRLNALFPDAKHNDLLWTRDTGNDGYQLRFGRHLSLSAAQMYQSLADKGLANGNALIVRE